MSIRFGRAIASDLSAAEDREWLVTNGIGGYASGTVAGSLSRGYHGVLVAALNPPIDRRLMCVKLDEVVTYAGQDWPLATNRWHESGDTSPCGLHQIQAFELVGSVATWRFAVGDALIDKQIWMVHGENTTYVRWTVVAADGPVILQVRAIVDNRIFHNTRQTDWPKAIVAVDGGIRVDPSPQDGVSPGRSLFVLADGATAAIDAEWMADFYLPAERLRGLADTDNHAQAAVFTATVAPGASLTLLASAEDTPALDPNSLATRQAWDAGLISKWKAARSPGDWPTWAERLVYAADQFVVRRDDPDTGAEGRSVIAGYHWFEDWGRDTMISLPGLTLATGRSDEAAPILRTFAKYLKDGLLPNRFPDVSEAPQYNTIDATLWYFQAIRAYWEATGDAALLKALWPDLQAIVQHHLDGTGSRVNGVTFTIKVDPADGLLSGGAPGVQLTWMDAIVDGRVITPRIGKPVEVNALWFNALKAMEVFAAALGEDGSAYTAQAAKTAQGFERFWNASAGYCFDVLDGPGGDETHLRPNQLLAISLPEPLLDAARREQILDACGDALLTSHGLRSLAPTDAAYQGHYGGDQAQRDGAYHQGTVWAWLIGPYVSAHLRVKADPAAALRLLTPFGDHLTAAGLGSISEIFDGDAPFTPRGCIAQAWSVGEVLRAMDATVAALAQGSTSNTSEATA